MLSDMTSYKIKSLFPVLSQKHPKTPKTIQFTIIYLIAQERSLLLKIPCTLAIGHREREINLILTRKHFFLLVNFYTTKWKFVGFL